MPRFQVLDKSSSNGYGIYSRMQSEVLVLELDKCCLVFVRNRIARRESPLPVIGYPGSKKVTSAVIDHCRIADPFKKVGREAEKVPDEKACGSAQAYLPYK